MWSWMVVFFRLHLNHLEINPALTVLRYIYIDLYESVVVMVSMLVDDSKNCWDSG